MGEKIRQHIRSNVIGYVALFVALSGTAYASHPGGFETIDSGDIKDAEVTGPDLAPGSVGSGKIIDGSVRSGDVADDTTANALTGTDVANTDSLGSPEIGGLGSADVTDQSLTGADVAADGLDASDISEAGLNAGGEVDGTLGNLDIGVGEVGTNEIADGGVGNLDLAANSVTGPKVAFGSLTGTDILNETLSGNDILDGTLSSSDIGAGAVGSSEVANASLGTAEFASSIPAVHVTRTTDQGVNNNTSTTLNFNSERYDTAGMHSNSSNISRLTAPVTGIYAVTVRLSWATQGAFPSGERLLILRKNGTTEVGADGRDADTAPSGGVDVNFTTMLRLAAGDFLEARVFQDSGDNRSIRTLGESSPEFSMTWLAPGPP